ncbi:MAG TPA: signal peptidase I [Patescibacteria group bacterium]|nr:signal peptidase I [Patescibacteria group bacterium]
MPIHETHPDVPEPVANFPVEPPHVVSSMPQTPGVGPSPHQAPVSSSNRHEGLKSVLSTLAILIIAPLLALSLTAFVFQSYEVDGPSMESTLQNQDRLIVLKVPRTLAKLTGHAYIPHRGDVIIFNEADAYDFGTPSQKQLVKRVIGLPGERLVVKDGVITIYNKRFPHGFQPDKSYPYGSVIPATSGNLDMVIPSGQIFVCGDNRGNSLDSRIFGPVPVQNVVGKLVMRIFPFNKVKTF